MIGQRDFGIAAGLTTRIINHQRSVHILNSVDKSTDLASRNYPKVQSNI